MLLNSPEQPQQKEWLVGVPFSDASRCHPQRRELLEKILTLHASSVAIRGRRRVFIRACQPLLVTTPRSTFNR